MDQSAESYFDRVAQNFSNLRHLAPEIEEAALRLIERVQRGGKILFCGNGGSAADSQHLAAEFMGRYLKDRDPLPALALTVDTSALTAIGNDYGFADVFARQIRGIGTPPDVLVGLSTSGNSENVVKAMHAARQIGMLTIGMTGRGGGRLKAISDIAICAPASETNHIQEMHIAIGHYLCGRVEEAVC